MNKENIGQTTKKYRSQYRARNIKRKYPRQKYLPEYRGSYSWLLEDETDPYFVFCTICECRLAAKKSDLGKHECSKKHIENQKNKDTNATQKKAERQNLINATRTCIDLTEEDRRKHTARQIERCNKLSKHDAKENDDDVRVMLKRTAYATNIDKPSIMKKNPLVTRTQTPQLLLNLPAATTTDFRQNETISTPRTIYLKKVTPAPGGRAESTGPPSKTQRDPCAIFFDSVCASIKALPPALAAEGKTRIMQLIGELEVRAITKS